MFKSSKAALAVASLLVTPALADMGHNHAMDLEDSVKSAADNTKVAAFDILAAHIHRQDNQLVFHMTTRGPAGGEVPHGVDQLGGAPVWSYVWPTSMDPSVVGFEEGAGILAMAATNHPDFDDTPLFDENGDGDLANDGGVWHSHWVVLAPTETCGPGSLAVRDIPAGASPDVPATWPGLPLMIDSPGYSPVFDGPEVAIHVPVSAAQASFNYDGVTSALRVNEDIHAPLLCVTNVFDVASGDLSLPGEAY